MASEGARSGAAGTGIARGFGGILNQAGQPGEHTHKSCRRSNVPCPGGAEQGANQFLGIACVRLCPFVDSFQASVESAVVERYARCVNCDAGWKLQDARGHPHLVFITDFSHCSVSDSFHIKELCVFTHAGLCT
jgi:hypothetical protein